MPVHIRLLLTLSLAVMTLFVLRSGPAYAEWVAISGDDDGTTAYVDPATIRTKGDLVKMWTLYDSKTVETFPGGSFFSIKRQKEYDCAEERTRTLAEIHFSGNMGSGKVLSSNADERKWVPVAPGSVGEALWQYACKKK